jgi:hypothetical protein
VAPSDWCDVPIRAVYRGESPTYQIGFHEARTQVIPVREGPDWYLVLDQGSWFRFNNPFAAVPARRG